MRGFAPRPFLLALTLVLSVGAIAELRLEAPGADVAGTQANSGGWTSGVTQGAGESTGETDDPDEKGERMSTGSSADTTRSNPPDSDANEKPQRTVSDEERIAAKAEKYERAGEITGSTGLVNTDDVSMEDAAGEKVVLVEFWTYTCFNCQNAQPHINALHEEYEDDGLQVIGVHTPEFGFEREISNVREAVRQANIEYPVVLDNHYAIWNAYDQRFWPAWYLIDADGFVRYRHFGEGAYEETEQKVQQLLAERDRVVD
jgi:thiol-disulfide isomerase/thioredoxin